MGLSSSLKKVETDSKISGIGRKYSYRGSHVRLRRQADSSFWGVVVESGAVLLGHVLGCCCHGA